MHGNMYVTKWMKLYGIEVNPMVSKSDMKKETNLLIRFVWKKDCVDR